MNNFKEILRKVPGFRSNTTWKKVISIIYFLFCLLMLTTEFQMFLFFFIIPFFIFHLISIVKNKKNKSPIKKEVIGAVIAFFLMIGSLSTSSVEPEDNDIAKSEDKPVDSVVINNSNSKENIDLKLEIIEKVNNGKVKFEINTNLPDSTEGLVTLLNESIDHTAQSKVVIKNGSGITEEFSNKGEPLVSGLYKIAFSTPVYELQPESVQKFIGENYKNIKSEYLNDGELGKNIIYEKEINLKTSDVSEEEIINQNESEKEVLIELYNDLNKKYLSNKKNPDMPSWAEFGRSLNDKTTNLNNTIKDTNLSMALGYIKQLHSEYTKLLQGRDGDAEYFKQEIEERLN